MSRFWGRNPFLQSMSSLPFIAHFGYKMCLHDSLLSRCLLPMIYSLKIPWFIPHVVQVWRNFVSYTWHAPIGCSEVVNGPIRHFLSPLTLVDFHFWVDHFQNLMKCVKHPFELLSHLCTSSFGFLSSPPAHFDHIDQNCFSPDHLGYVLARLSNMSSNTLNKVSRLTP